jgi:hypothetical protein
MAAQRVVRYFLTEVELTDASDDEKEKYEEFLNNQIKIMEVLATVGDNYMAYGNSFVSLHVPFRRYLRCPKCHLERPLNAINWQWENYQFLGTCESCSYKGHFTRVDRRSLGQDQIKVVHWSPHEIRIMYHPVSGKKIYLWEINALFKNEIKKGNPFYLEETSWEIIEAIKHDKLFRFNNDFIYHVKDETLAGVRMHGWGLPLIMANFKQAWYIQVLKRYNEAIALDYIIPFRVITPTPGTSREADPLLHMNVGNFYSRVMNMFRQHRRDPTTIHALPFSIDLKMLGADAKNLAPTDLIDKATDEFLNSQGVPAELYKGSLQIQAAPVALRLFERTWVHLVNGMNGFLNWMFKRTSELQNWENLKGRLLPVTLSDDLEKKQTQLQLAASGQISNDTSLRPLGINFREETKKKFDEQEFMEEAQAKYQERAAQRQELQQTMAQGSAGMAQPGTPGGPAMPPMDPSQGGGMPPGGGGMPPGGGMPMGGGMPTGGGPGGSGITPDDMMAQAEQIAYQMLGMPYEQRKSQLLQIKKSNETLHALIISKMKTIKQQAQSQGGQQMLQQQLGGG